jgi:alpha-galactosidase
MPLPTKISVIGAGSASFGLNTLAALVHSPSLHGSQLALVDSNPETLGLVGRLAERLNREWKAGMKITTHTQHEAALEGAEFVVLSIEAPPREALWRKDYEIPLKYGVRQPYAENGGPGGFAHAARNIGPVMEIVRNMEQICPEAWFINYTNPMMRICDAVNRYSKIKVVGLCHQILAGICMVGIALESDLGIQVPEGITGMYSDLAQVPLHEQVVRQVKPLLELHAAGLNHFSWALDIHDRRTGQDLYPLFRQRWNNLDPQFEPLTRRLFDAFGLFPISGDTHLCEYLPWLSYPDTHPWEKFNIHLYDWEVFTSVRDYQMSLLRSLGDGSTEIDTLTESDSEGALEMIENIAGAGNHYHMAANLPNLGQISNLPLGAIVETPVMVDGAGIHPVQIGRLPEGIAELCQREISAAQLCVDAAVHGDRQTALQCLLLDPVISDLDLAQRILDDYLDAYRDYLPQFWK